MQNLPESQKSLLTFENELSDDQKASLQAQITSLDLSKSDIYFNRVMKTPESEDGLEQSKLQPVSSSRTNAGSTEADSQKWEALGLEQVKANKVGVLLLAGGQGTRLGSALPKGCLTVGNLSKKTLFQLQIERLRKVETNGNGNIQFYVMTSPATHKAISEEFERENYFGLDKNQVTIFNQGLLPCFDFSGQVFLKNKSEIATAPDGNGGLWKALRKNGIVDHMREHNLENIHMYCVDNVLTKVADPKFIGFCVDKNADCAAKCVEKSLPHESVGVVCTYNGKARVVEYSEISKEIAEMKDSEIPEKLAYRAGNICNHYFSVDFIDKASSDEWEDKLVHHIAKKKIPTICLKTGEVISPETPNGIKLEKFVFDVFEFSESFALYIDARLQEFSPLKNHEDKTAGDNARSARSHLHRLHHSWVLAAGGKFKDEEANSISESLDFSDKSKDYKFQVEVSPLVSYAGEGLGDLCDGKVFDLPLSL
jgi:UDP-N-acetylglucosamine/UDP-N-acetylgalactosamine diphosphorylase